MVAIAFPPQPKVGDSGCATARGGGSATQVGRQLPRGARAGLHRAVHGAGIAGGIGRLAREEQASSIGAASSRRRVQAAHRDPAVGATGQGIAPPVETTASSTAVSNRARRFPGRGLSPGRGVQARTIDRVRVAPRSSRAGEPSAAFPQPAHQAAMGGCGPNAHQIGTGGTGRMKKDVSRPGWRRPSRADR